MSIWSMCVYYLFLKELWMSPRLRFEKRNMPRFAMGAISWSLQAYVMIMRCDIWCHMDIQERIHLSPQLHYFRTSFDIWIALKLHNEEFCLKLARCICNCQPAVALIDLVTKCTARDSSKSFKTTTALWIRLVLFGCLKACKDWDLLVAMTCKKDAQHDRPRQTPNPENRDCVKAKLGQGKADLPNWARRMKNELLILWISQLHCTHSLQMPSVLVEFRSDTLQSSSRGSSAVCLEYKHSSISVWIVWHCSPSTPEVPDNTCFSMSSQTFASKVSKVFECIRTQ